MIEVQVRAGALHRPAKHHGSFFAHHGVWAPGVRLFRSLMFSTKAFIISMAFIVPSGLMVLWLLFALSDEAMQAHKDTTREHVEVAHGVVAWAHAKEVGGKLSREQAQQLALEAIVRLRYNGSEYFWINDMEPRVLMHPIKPELTGKPVGDIKDPNGLALFKAFVDKVKTDGRGFVAYQWPKPGASEPQDKIAYVQGFEPWGWIIGSGVYVDDVRREVMVRAAWLAGSIALASGLAGYLFTSFYRVMDGGLKETRRHLHGMASGDLTTSPAPWGRDEPAQLMVELRVMQDFLRNMVRNVRASSEEIVHNSKEVASGTLDLSSRTESAAANLEEAAASMEQITATVNNTASNTDEAARLAQENAAAAAEGGRVMTEVVRTMEGIHSSSTRIGEIIGTIDGIAFQTNILALNAAVEAARAGEQGRGFAVVASEVRSLAQRSAVAAREIKTLIGESVQQVECGSAVVRQAGKTIGQIVDSSRRVSELLGEVANGTREQTLGISQIGQAVHDLDRMTQQNAALVEQTAAASSTMRDRAHALAEQVARFSLPADLPVVQAAEDKADLASFDFDKAIEAHRNWKVTLRKAIAHRERLDAETICRDDRCALGQWIHGTGGERFGSRKLFTDLLSRHASFHIAAGEAAQRINAGSYEDAERLIGSGSNFARASTEVTTLLTNFKHGT